MLQTSVLVQGGSKKVKMGLNYIGTRSLQDKCRRPMLYVGEGRSALRKHVALW